MRRTHHSSTIVAFLIATLLAASSHAADPLDPLPNPDGKPADTSKPVRVYVLMGQSNMLGFGAVEPEGTPGTLAALVKAGRYPFLTDDTGAWSVRNDVRDVFVMQNRNRMQVNRNTWLTPPAKGRFGPELGFGQVMGTVHEAPVLLLKACIGNRSLGWDLLPPGSGRYEFVVKDRAGVEKTMVYAGYKDRPESWPMDPAKGKATEPPPWLDKKTGKPIEWYAGKQGDDDLREAKKALADLEKHYPGAGGYEVAGFFFWQGEKDAGNPGHAAKYEENLVRFIKTVRKEFDAPNAKFVLATMGESVKGGGGSGGKVLEGHLAVDGTSGKYPEFKGNVATIYTHPMAQGGSGNGHYGGKAEVYMDVGEAMGKAMVELLKNGQ